MNWLRVRKFEESSFDVTVCLSKVYELISKLYRQVYQSQCGDAHRVEFFWKVAISYDWSHRLLSKVVTYNLSFQEMYVELEGPLQIHN